MIQLRTGVSARDENSFARLAALIPQYGNAMSGILAVEADTLRHKPRPHVLKANQTDAGHGEATIQLWTEAGGKLSLHHFRVNPEVSKDSSADYALNNW